MVRRGNEKKGDDRWKREVDRGEVSGEEKWRRGRVGIVFDLS